MQLVNLLVPFILLILPAAAQFQFFEQMFNGQQQQQQQPQNAGSDSAWYQQQYEGGKPLNKPETVQLLIQLLITFFRSSLRQVLMPTHPLLCPLPASLSLCIPSSGR